MAEARKGFYAQLQRGQVPGWLAPVTSTGVPVGSDPLVQPSVAVLPPVPEQWAACPMYSLPDPS